MRRLLIAARDQIPYLPLYIGTVGIVIVIWGGRP